MGVEYQIHDLANKRRFDLGKGPYACGLRTYLLEKTHSSIALGNILISACRNYDEVDAIQVEYIKEVAQKVWDFCEASNWQIEIQNDCLDYPEERDGWPIVGSRYL